MNFIRILTTDMCILQEKDGKSNLKTLQPYVKSGQQVFQVFIDLIPILLYLQQIARTFFKFTALQSFKLTIIQIKIDSNLNQN